MEFGIIALVSMCCVGWHIASNSLLHDFTGKDYSDYWPDLKRWQKNIIKPLGGCPTCMASVCGTIGHFYLGGSLEMWPVTVLSLAYLNTQLNKWAHD